MEIGDLVKTIFGDVGRVITKTDLASLMSGDADPYTYEGDLPYLICEKEDGTSFGICEYECEKIEEGNK